LTVPPAASNLAPSVGLSYSSAAVDGKSSAAQGAGRLGR